MNCEKIYSGYGVLFAYLIGLVGILSGYWNNYTLLGVSLIALLIWDIGFMFSKVSFYGRDSKNLIESIARSRWYVTWFFAVYGAVIGFLINSSGSITKFILTCAKASIPLTLLISPMIIALTTTLFISIQLVTKDDAEKDITKALKTLYTFNIFFEKVILIMMGHLFLRLLANWTVA